MKCEHTCLFIYPLHSSCNLSLGHKLLPRAESASPMTAAAAAAIGQTESGKSKREFERQQTRRLNRMK